MDNETNINGTKTGKKIKITQPSNENFSSFVKTKMYVLLYLELWHKSGGNSHPTQATHYKSHPAEGTKRKESREVRLRWVKCRQCFK